MQESGKRKLCGEVPTNRIRSQRQENAGSAGRGKWGVEMGTQTETWFNPQIIGGGGLVLTQRFKKVRSNVKKSLKRTVREMGTGSTRGRGRTQPANKKKNTELKISAPSDTRTIGAWTRERGRKGGPSS